MASCTFKPKGMSYTEFMRSKKAASVNIIDTKPVRTASEITNARRLEASTVFALNNEAVKGSITTPIDFSQGGLHPAGSYYKDGGASRRVGSASEFTAFSGSQAIGRLVQAGVPPTRILQESNFNLVSAPVAQGASDSLRRDQGCKLSLGQQHDLTTVTPPKFVDNTIRNTGSPACVTRQAIHDIKDESAFPQVPNRPSQAGGQYALKGDIEPGKDLGAVGDNPHYKAGAAIKNIPYVEKHHGNDLGVNPKRPFVKYQIPKGTPPHLKINRPKTAGGYVAPPPIPPTLLEQIATLTSPNVYTLNATTVILLGQTLTIPLGITFKIPPELLLTNNGTIVCLGTIDNDAFINNRVFTITSTGTFITTVVFTNRAGATVTNSGAIRITSPGNISNSGTITNNAGSTLTNSGTVTNNTGSVLTNSGTVTNNVGAVLTNFASFTNNTGRTVTNSGTITNNSTGTLTNNGTITSTSTSTLTNIGTITNNSTGTITGDPGITYTNTGTNTNTGTFVITQPISAYVPLVNGIYTVSSNVTIPRFVTITNIYNVFINPGATLTNNGRIDNAPYFITIDGTFVNTSFGTLLANNQIFNSGTLTNNGGITNTSTITNNSGSNFTNNSGARLTNSGTITSDLGSTFTNNGTITNTGTIEAFVPLTNYATLAGNTYTLNSGDQIIPLYTVVTVPAAFTLLIPISRTLSNNGKIVVAGTLTMNGSISHNGSIVNNAGGTINMNSTLNFESDASLINYGTITMNGSGSQIYNPFRPITNNGTIDVTAGTTFYSSGATVNSKSGGTITIRTGGTLYIQDRPLTNEGTISSQGRMVITSTLINDGEVTNSIDSTLTINSGTIYNYNGGTITVDGTKTGSGQVNNANGSGACGTGTLNGTNPLVATGTACPPA